MVGKYTVLKDAYKSLIEALIHGGVANRVEVNLDWVESETFEGDEGAAIRLEGVHGILVPGGFGERGAEGKIRGGQFAREHDVPYFGVCFGMQMAVIEAARNVAGMTCASSTEFGPTQEPVVGLMTEWTRGNEREIRSAEATTSAAPCGWAPMTPCSRPARKVAEIYGATTHQRAPSPSLRGQHRLSRGLRGGRAEDDRRLARRPPARDRRARGPSLVHGRPVPPGAEEPPLRPHPLFPSFIAAALEQSRLV